MHATKLNELKHLLPPGAWSVGESNLAKHSRDESPFNPVEPDIVVFPESTEEVVQIMKFAYEHSIPVTAFGAGSGLEGQAIPLEKGISVSFERMNAIVQFYPEDMIVKVQPGITRLQLNEKVNTQGLYFPIDPGADASIGGMCATNASGTTAVRYGSMRDQVLDLKIVLADGRVIHTGSMSKKSSSGYSLNGLFVGSEGTLGIITEVTMKLHGIPEHVVAARCTFDTPKECIEASQAVLLSGIPVLRMEYVDDVSIKQVNAYGNYTIPEAHSLFFEFAGSKASVEDNARYVEELMNDLGAKHWARETNSKNRADLWKARHEMSYAFGHLPGLKNSGADVCVPISKLANLIVYTRGLIDDSGLLGGIFGHVGDGNFHTSVMYDPKDEEQTLRAESIKDKITFMAIDLGGTCTGEHGVGLGKKKFQMKEHGEAIEVMKSFKTLLDPKNILNPNKIFD